MPQLHVESLSLPTIPRTHAVQIEEAFHAFLTREYLRPVGDGEELQFDEFQYKDHVAYAQVTGTDTGSKCGEDFLFADVQLKVHAYTLHEQAAATSTVTFNASKDSQARVVNIPHDSLAGIWESRALAQKLVIRLSWLFRGGKLFEINTQDLLSKFYSESGKLVSEMFDKVLKMAHDDKELVCVLIDEIESIATSRQVSTKNGECTDTVRATNQLLTALDRIRNKPNIIVFCTSNLVDSIDAAFLDRVYDIVPVPPPCASAVYTILINILNELIDVGMITYDPWAQTLPLDDDQGPKRGFNFLDLGDYLDKSHLPSYERLAVWEMAFPDSPGPLLKSIAKDCAGFSGRKLAKLPFLAITKYVWQEKCTIFDAIKALQKAVKLDKV
ncbi:AAA-domain-containing protein, partial [Aureobasidium sp. EXF-8845]